jgi:hypothetical protein
LRPHAGRISQTISVKIARIDVMGGAGSGHGYRPSRSIGKLTVEACQSIDVDDWSQRGWLNPHVSCFSDGGLWLSRRPDSLDLSYHYRGELRRDSIRLTSTPCPYGGRRLWFLCPNMPCRRRVAKLYLRGGFFRCRACHRLTYASQREARCYQAMKRAHLIQERLGGRPGYAYPFPPKPKGMHWRTYDRWQRQFDEAVQADWGATVKKFGWLDTS